MLWHVYLTQLSGKNQPGHSSYPDHWKNRNNPMIYTNIINIQYSIESTNNNGAKGPLQMTLSVRPYVRANIQLNGIHLKDNDGRVCHRCPHQHRARIQAG